MQSAGIFVRQRISIFGSLVWFSLLADLISLMLWGESRRLSVLCGSGSMALPMYILWQRYRP